MVFMYCVGKATVLVNVVWRAHYYFAAIWLVDYILVAITLPYHRPPIQS